MKHIINMKEIKIAGRGPAGLMAATAASGACGIRIYGFPERRTYPVAIRKEDFDVLISFLKSKKRSDIIKLLSPFPVHKARKMSPHHEASFESKDPIFYVFLRGNTKNSIDSLFSSSLSGKAEFIEDKTNLDNCDIDASGPKRFNVLGTGAVIEDIRSDEIKIYYNNRYADKGYVCSIPFGKKIFVLSVSFGTANINKSTEKLKSLLKSETMFNERLEPSYYVTGKENYFYPPVPCRGNTLICGSAGGFFDATRGFGHFYAMITGFMAGLALSHTGSFSEAKKEYIAMWKPLLQERLKTEFEKRVSFFNSFTNNDYDRIIKEISGKSNYVSISRQKTQSD